MAKNKTEIHVTTVFDGELDATDVFVSLISQKYGKTNTKEYLAKKKDISYNEDEVQKSQIPSGLYGKKEEKKKNTEQSVRHLPGAIVQRSIAGCQRTMTCKAKVPVSQTSVICWKNTAKSRDGRLWQSIRTMASQVLTWSVLIYREC